MILENILHHRKILRIPREYPTLLFIIAITIMFFGNRNEGVILFLAFLTSEILNKIFKTGFKSIMKDKKYPIIGMGKRPPVAVFQLPQDGKMYKTSINSYGMPSGHSQIAVLFSTYIILRTYYNSALSLPHKLAIYALMIFLGFYVIYARIKEYWHTFQQTMVGGTIGLILGYFTYKSYVIYK
jgi:membrane-associated phospholipid phosphatase